MAAAARLASAEAVSGGGGGGSGAGGGGIALWAAAGGVYDASRTPESYHDVTTIIGVRTRAAAGRGARSAPRADGQQATDKRRALPGNMAALEVGVTTYERDAEAVCLDRLADVEVAAAQRDFFFPSVLKQRGAHMTHRARAHGHPAHPPPRSAARDYFSANTKRSKGSCDPYHHHSV